MSDTPSGALQAAALATADRHFAEALCSIVREMREAQQADPERIALELEFALRGCYWTDDADVGECLRNRAANLLEQAGGTTRLTMEQGKPRPRSATEPGLKRMFG